MRFAIRLKHTKSIIWLGVITILLPVALASQDSYLCPSVESRLFEAIRIPDNRGLNPGVTYGGVVLRGREDAILCYFRAGNQYERARYTARELNNIFIFGVPPVFEVIPPGRHEEAHRGSPCPYSTEHWAIFANMIVHADRTYEILAVRPGDMVGFKYRAPGGRYHDARATQGLHLKEAHEINAELVAQWWAANLEDLCAMFVCSIEPTKTAGTFAGEIYSKIYHEGRKLHPEGVIEIDDWLAVLQDLSFPDRKALRRAGQFIPEEFERNDYLEERN